MPPPLVTRVYLEDTDAGGIVYHATYFRYMERARTELLRRAGIQQSESFARDLSFVVHSMNVRFHAPAKLDDELETSCDLGRALGASLRFVQEVRRRGTGELCCSAEVTVACIALSTGKPRRVPRELLDKLV